MRTPYMLIVYIILPTTFSNQPVGERLTCTHPNTGFFLFPRVLPSPIAAASYFLMASGPQPPPRTAPSFAIHSCHDHISRPIVNRSTVISVETHRDYSFKSPSKVIINILHRYECNFYSIIRRLLYSFK